MDNSELEQRSDDWHQARLGKVTASKVADVIAKTRSGWAASRANYMAQLVVERLTDRPTENYVSAAMQYGMDTEAEARIAYEFYRDVEVVEVGFIDHPSIEMSGASPDGCVGDDGMVEIKCPNSATHIDTLLGQPLPDKYIVQMQWQMACAGRQWCDFVSYDPRMPEDLRLFVERVKRDDKRLAELAQSVTDFLAELDERIEALQSISNSPEGNHAD